MYYPLNYFMKKVLSLSIFEDTILTCGGSNSKSLKDIIEKWLVLEIVFRNIYFNMDLIEIDF